MDEPTHYITCEDGAIIHIAPRPKVEKLLLASLKEVLAAWIYEAKQGDGILEEHGPVYTRAKALIAKAEGRE